MVHIVLFERPDLAIESIYQSLLYYMPFAFCFAMTNAIANRLSVQDASSCIQQMSKCVDKEDIHLLLLYCVVNNCWKLLLSLVDTEVPRDDIDYIHDMKNVSKRYGKLSTIFPKCTCRTFKNILVIETDCPDDDIIQLLYILRRLIFESLGAPCYIFTYSPLADKFIIIPVVCHCLFDDFLNGCTRWTSYVMGSDNGSTFFSGNIPA